MKKYLIILLFLFVNPSYAGPVIGWGGGPSSLIAEDFSFEGPIIGGGGGGLNGERSIVDLSALIAEGNKERRENNITELINISRAFENLDNGDRINISNYRSYLNPTIE